MDNKRINYSITFLSDTCCGTGTGNGSDVDISASFDEAGLPIIPAMRLRGLLREQAFLLDEKYGSEAIFSLFGDSGKKSRLAVKTATIKNSADIKRDLVIDKSISPKEVSEVFTVKRASTAIDKKTGTAQKGSLRTIATVKAGVVFEGYVTIKDATETDVQIIRDAFALLRNIGLSKHRGLGEVSCKTESAKNIQTFVAPSSYTSGGPLYTCDYKLVLQQNVALMLNSPMQTPDYIPGASVQGVIAGLFAGQPYFDQLFFDDLKFGNAYISEEQKTGDPFAFRPSPLSYVMVKNEPGTAYDLADGAIRDPDKQYVPMGGYMYSDFNGRFISRHNVISGTDYHINKAQNNKVSKKSFRNTVRIEKGQVFVGSIFGSQAALELVKNALNGSIVTIGAAGASEYGECLAVVNSAELCENFKFSNGSRIVAELISDAVIVNSIGTNSTRVCDFVDSIAGPGAFKVATDPDGRSLVFAKTETVGGYNAKWGMPKSQASAFTKGTTIVLECCKDVSLGSFIGIRNDEGFGQVIFHECCGASSHEIDSLNLMKKIDVPTGKAASVIDAIHDIRYNKEAELKALEAANELHSNELSSSAAMRVLSLYQALRAANRVTQKDFKNEIEKLKKNGELLKLAKSIEYAYSGTGLDEKYFDKYLRAFLTRYKEISRQKRTDEKSSRGGNY